MSQRYVNICIIKTTRLTSEQRIFIVRIIMQASVLPCEHEVQTAIQVSQAVGLTAESIFMH